MGAGSVGGECWNGHMFESVQQLLVELLGSGAPEATTSEPQPSGTPAAARPDCLSARQLVDRIAAAERLVHAVQAAQREDIAAFARARMATDDDLSMVGSRLRGRTVGTELALALNVSPTAGASRATLAAAATEDHPALSSLAVRGEISEYSLRLVTRETEVLPPEQRRLVDAQIADDVTNAGGLTPGRLRQAAARRTIAIDPYAATRRCEAARNHRAFGVMDPRDGTATLWARLRAEEALAVHQSIDTTARRLRADGDERSLANLRCDLLVQATTDADPSTVLSLSQPVESSASDEDPALEDAAWDSYSSAGARVAPAPRRQRRVEESPMGQPSGMPVPARVELQIVMAASTLLGLDQEPAMLRGYGAIPAAIAARVLDCANGAAPSPNSDTRLNSDANCVSGGGLGGSSTGVLVRRLLCDPVDGRLIGMDTGRAATPAGCASSPPGGTRPAGCRTPPSWTSTTSTAMSTAAPPRWPTGKDCPRTRTCCATTQRCPYGRSHRSMSDETAVRAVLRDTGSCSRHLTWNGRCPPATPTCGDPHQHSAGEAGRPHTIQHLHPIS